MNHPLVRNVRKARADVYIGRVRGADMHFGNPFTHSKDPNVLTLVVRVPTRDDAVGCYEAWLKGADQFVSTSAFVPHLQEVQPFRREWILEHLPELKGKTLGCFCAPLACHGDVLAELANKESE